MKDTSGYGKNGFNYHKPSNFRDDYPYNGKAHVEEWETYLERKQAKEKGKQRRKLKCVLKRLPTDMKQELLAALLSELKGE